MEVYEKTGSSRLAELSAVQQPEVQGGVPRSHHAHWPNTRGEAIKTLPTDNRYRDTAVSNGGRTTYVITDSSGSMLGHDSKPVTKLANPGAVLAFTYTVNPGVSSSDQHAAVSQSQCLRKRLTALAVHLIGTVERFFRRRIEDVMHSATCKLRC